MSKKTHDLIQEIFKHTPTMVVDTDDLHGCLLDLRAGVVEGEVNDKKAYKFLSELAPKIEKTAAKINYLYTKLRKFVDSQEITEKTRAPKKSKPKKKQVEEERRKKFKPKKPGGFDPFG